jgi:serine/threonine protein kinase
MKKKIAGYEIEQLLGEGGMGVVYLARDSTLDRALAIKVIRQESIGSEGKERFLREARACSRINHPNIVTVYAAGEEDGCPYLAMELLKGQSLREIIDGGPIPWERALEWLASILDALGRLHQEGIVHRDLKPENIMVTPEGTIKLMDFGVASLASSATLTKEETTLGTAFYMSPEQAAGAKVGPRSDLFAVGIILYELVTGRRPFRGDHPMAVLYAIVNEPPLPLEKTGDDLPEGLKAVLARALEKDPEKRFPDAASFGQALVALLKGEADSVDQAYRADRGRRNLLSFILPVAVMIGLAVVISSWLVSTRMNRGDRATATLHNERGQDYHQMGVIDSARAEYQRAILADREYEVPWNNLAVLSIGENELEEADSLLLEALAIDPEYAAALFNLGLVHWKRGDPEGAEEFYRASLDADSSFWQGYSMLGDLLLQLDRVGEAGEILDEGLLGNPEHPYLLKNRGRVAVREGEDEAAREYWERALSELPDNVELHHLLAEWYERKGRNEEAIDHWSMVSRSDLAADKEEAQRALERLEKR